MIYIIFTLFLDLFLTFFISVSYQNINYFFPLIMVASIPIFYSLLKNKKLFFLVLLVTGILYDTLFSDVFLVNTYYYLLFGFFGYVFYERHDIKLINIVLLSIIGVLLYDVFIFFTLILIDYSVFSFYDLEYKLLRTFLLNFIYILFSIIIFRSRIFGLKRCKKR